MSTTTDCIPLQELRKDLSGDCCSWAGVTCDKKTGRVTAIRWFNTRITGSISPGLGGLTNLTDLDLSSNQLTGSIPPELGSLKNLKQLELNKNKLSGPIPSELGGLDSLTTLSLGNNELSGTIPESLSSLPKLSYLYLYHNRLSGPLTKLPNPSSGCSMISTFNEDNNYGCVPLGATGKCAADLIQNKVPECDANGNPTAPTSTTSSRAAAASPTQARGSTGSRQTHVAKGGGDDAAGSSASESGVFPTFTIIGVFAGLLGLLAVSFFVFRRRQQKRPTTSAAKLPLNPSQPQPGPAPLPQAIGAQQQQQEPLAYQQLTPAYVQQSSTPPSHPHQPPHAYPLALKPDVSLHQAPGHVPSPPTPVGKPDHEDPDAILYLPPMAPVAQTAAAGGRASGDLELILPPAGPSLVRKQSET
ncbi:hypothetical protein BCR44DRAFT_35129 [Catenaria anguillulae PL171]|uniref:Leucine-rich repeat-containing N-terminal plant-type domain-containing protein n=1 Tax=Catenaria anguillulae PL171 TaxID=765915 RepID=A0A1Y2HBM4_9FUNG|nr:hypothetical protein BCR44DRAFT_35129 [Catenaria anguillulae PL171]